MKIDKNGEPVWRDGDVVKIRFARKRDRNPKDGLMLSDEYEYIRDNNYWPGDAEWSSHTDDEMTAAWHDSRLLVMAMVSATIDPAAPLAEPYDLVRLRILERAVNNVRDIIDTTGLDRPLSSFIDEIRAVLP